MSVTKQELIWLAHELGKEPRGMAILGEGNVSGLAGEESIWVKSSGSQLSELDEASLVECSHPALLDLFDEAVLSDEQAHQALMDSRLDPNARKPSVEAVFHAGLLNLVGCSVVGHVHPTFCNSILCSDQGKEFATTRRFPDEVVCCGRASVWIPYTDPGLPLAHEIMDQVHEFYDEHNENPRLILLQNHGIIAIGTSAKEVFSTLLMAEKAAQIFVQSRQIGVPTLLSVDDIDRIHSRPDEHYRQAILRGEN